MDVVARLVAATAPAAKTSVVVAGFVCVVAGITTGVTDTDRQALGLILAGLDFPLRRWEIITAADWYGADAWTTRWLQALPAHDRPYRDLGDLMTALDHVRLGPDRPAGQ